MRPRVRRLEGPQAQVTLNGVCASTITSNGVCASALKTGGLPNSSWTWRPEVAGVFCHAYAQRLTL